MKQQEYIPPQTARYETESQFAETASAGQRFINYIIDLTVFYVIMYGTGIIIGILLLISGRTFEPLDNSTPGNILSNYFVGITFYILYYTFAEGASGGRSLAKLITGTKVVKEDDSEITWRDALVRSLCRLIPFEPLSTFGGYPWHDQISNTKVIRIKSNIKNY